MKGTAACGAAFSLLPGRKEDHSPDTGSLAAKLTQ